MKKYIFFLLFIFIFNYATGAGSWKLAKDSYGVKVYTRPVKGSNVDEYLGITHINAPIQSVFKVLNDIPSHTSWRANCIESRVIKRLNANTIIIYNVTKAPWPVDNRDVVIKVTNHTDPANGNIIINLLAVRGNYVPLHKGYVRITDLTGSYQLINSGNGTTVKYRVRLDPGGNLPASMARQVSIDMPYKTLIGLRKMAAQ